MRNFILILLAIILLIVPVYGDDYDLFIHHGTIMLIINPDSGEILFANQSAAEFYQWTIDELLEMNISEINTLTSNEVQSEMQLAKFEARNFFKFRHIIRDGSIRDVEVYSSPIEFEEQKVLFSIIIDVTDEIALENEIALRNKKDRIKLVNFIALMLAVFGIMSLLGFLLVRKNRMLKSLTRKDHLTGINNRIAIRLIYDHELKKNRLPIAFFMIDVNNLKFINDTYGHVIGDQMIIKVSEMLKETTYQDAFIARVSGDEFVVIISDCGEASAYELEKAIKNKSIVLENVHFNVSVGLKLVDNCKISFEQAFSRAETEMYNFKTDKRHNVNQRIKREILEELYKLYPNIKDKGEKLQLIITEMRHFIEMSDDEYNALMESSHLIDIGMIIKDSSEENHAQKSYSILNALHMSNMVTTTCFYHHENFDGTGYPIGLSRGNIPYTARLISMANFLCYYQLKYHSSIITLKKAQMDSGSRLDPVMVKQIDNKTFTTFLDTI